MQTRPLFFGAALLVTGSLIGATTQHLASATVSSGDRTVLVPTEPCRLADTRSAPDTVGPRSVPLGPRDTLTIKSAETGTACTNRIPPDATALALNVTALGATELTFLTIWAGGDRPLAASLNPAPGQPPVPNAVITQLSDDGEFRIYNETGFVSVVIDVNGYYVDHDHDDRYFTEAEADDRFLTERDGDDRYLLDGPDVVHLATADFVPERDEWGINDLVWNRNAGASDCLLASLDLPAGAEVETVSIRYTAGTSPDVGVFVSSFDRTLTGVVDEFDTGSLHLVDQSNDLPATSPSEIRIAVVGTDPTDADPMFPIEPIAADDDTTLSICTDDSLAVFGVTVTIERP